MNTEKFHRAILPLSFWEVSGLIALAQTLRDTLTPGCDCAGIQTWGHTTACIMQTQYFLENNQRFCEAEEVRVTWDLVHSTHFKPVKAGFDMQLRFTEEFRPSGAGWVGFIQL